MAEQGRTEGRLEGKRAVAVLAYLDDLGSNRIPMMEMEDGPYYLVGRLKVYRDQDHWAMVFMMAHLDMGIRVDIYPLGPRDQVARWAEYITEHPVDTQALEQVMGGRVDKGSLFGWIRKLLSPKFHREVLKQHLLSMQVMEEKQARFRQAYAGKPFEEDLFFYPIDLEFDEDEQLQGIVVQGKPVEAAEFKALLGQLESEGVGTQEGDALAARIIQQYREQVFPTDAELARFFAGGLPPLFLSLDSWHHPNILEYTCSVGDLPLSQCELFQMLAKAIESGRVEDYAPSLAPNMFAEGWRGDHSV